MLDIFVSRRCYTEKHTDFTRKMLYNICAKKYQVVCLAPPFCHLPAGRKGDLRYIQEHLGHKSSKDAEIYTHIARKRLGKDQKSAG